MLCVCVCVFKCVYGVCVCVCVCVIGLLCHFTRQVLVTYIIQFYTYFFFGQTYDLQFGNFLFQSTLELQYRH